MLRCALWHCVRLLFYVIELWELIVATITRSWRLPPSIKCPRVVAIVVDSHGASEAAHKLADIVMYLASIGVRHVALYDPEGVLKHSGGQLEKSIRKATHSLRFNHKHETPRNGLKNGEKEPMIVELLSIEDGKDSIAEAAQTIYCDFSKLSQPQQQNAVNNLSEKQLDEYLRREAGHRKPDPELLFVFGRSNSLQGFPPWRIKLTEIMFMGALQSVSTCLVHSALREFSWRTQRYGK